MQTAFLFFWFALGAIFGSFLNVVIWRLPRGQRLTGRSQCPHCGHTLSWQELFPLLSYLALRGKCRKCRKPISPRYFAIESITGLLFALSWVMVQPEAALGYLSLAKYLLMVCVFVVVFMVDFEHYLILDNVVLPASAAMILLNIAADLFGQRGLLRLDSWFLSGILGAAAAALPFFLAWFFSQGRWMGFGDVKLALFLGVALGWPLVYVNILLAVFLGGFCAVFLLLGRKKTMKSQVPFGTFLALGGVVALFWGGKVLHWYLSFLGY